MKTDRELLEQILEKLTGLENDVTGLKNEVVGIENKIDRNYNLMVEFYGKQQEHNTEISEKLDNLSARQEIFENQTIRNTAELKRIK